MALFGTDGVRGIANEALSADLAMSLGRAVGRVLAHGKGHILIGRDTRISSPMLSSAFAAGASSVGVDVWDAGVLPTPAIAYLTEHYGARAGVVISASHNPYAYNGIKLFSRWGKKLSRETEEQIESALSHPPASSPTRDIGLVAPLSDGAGKYVRRLCALFPLQNSYRIAVDCANGATHAVARTLLTALGIDAHVLFDSPDGKNINDACGATDTRVLRDYVAENGLDCGFALDGDGDRLIAVDEKGREVNGDHILAMLARDARERGTLKGNAVVATVMSNLGLSRFCKDEGILLVAEQVGDRYVSERMECMGATLGGEQSGHIILSDLAPTGDGLLTMLAILSLMNRTHLPLSALRDTMHTYPQCTVSVPADDARKERFYQSNEVRRLLEELEETLGDRGRILVRPSGTEPLLRITVEGQTEKEARTLAEYAANALEAHLQPSPL